MNTLVPATTMMGSNPLNVGKQILEQLAIHNGRKMISQTGSCPDIITERHSLPATLGGPRLEDLELLILLPIPRLLSAGESNTYR